MTNVICDACKKSVPNAVRKKSYFTILNKSLCVQCEKEMQEILKVKMVKRGHYSIAGYKDEVKETLGKICK